MSFRTTIQCHLPVEVEIDREGHLTLHGYDADYDLAFTAMSGGGLSLCRVILESWDNFPYSVIGADLGLGRDVLGHLSLDLVEYLVRSGVLGWAHPESPHTEDLVVRHEALVEQLIAVGREYIETGMSRQALKEAAVVYRHERINVEQELGRVMGIYGLGTKNSDDVLEEFSQALDMACHLKRYLDPEGSSTFFFVAQKVRQTLYPRYIGQSQRPDQVGDVDRRLWRWFVARFVDVMEDWQPGQRWPRLPLVEEMP